MTLFKYDAQHPYGFGALDRWFDQAFGDRNFFDSLFDPAAGRGFPINLHDAGDQYLLEAELPGFSRDQVSIELENAVLNIRAERSLGEGKEARKQVLARAVTVGEDIETDKVRAKLEDGVLQVILPKAAGRQPRRIAVN